MVQHLEGHGLDCLRAFLSHFSLPRILRFLSPSTSTVTVRHRGGRASLGTCNSIESLFSSCDHLSSFFIVVVVAIVKLRKAGTHGTGGRCKGDRCMYHCGCVV